MAAGGTVGQQLAEMARWTVALALILSAGYKMLHPHDFRSALEQIVLVRRFRVLSGLVPPAEVAAAALLIVARPLYLSVVPSLVLLLAFTVAFLMADHRTGNGCGCWAQTGSSATWPFLLRNAILIVLTMILLVAPETAVGQPPIPDLCFDVYFGLLAASLIMELPTAVDFVQNLYEVVS
jgi:hypothetical protein